MRSMVLVVMPSLLALSTVVSAPAVARAQTAAGTSHTGTTSSSAAPATTPAPSATPTSPAGSTASSPAPASSATPPSPPGPNATAAELRAAAHQALSEGRFESAMDMLERASRQTTDPTVWLEVGDAADRLRRNAEALEAYRHYLEVAPNAPDRAEVAARIRVLASLHNLLAPWPYPDAPRGHHAAHRPGQEDAEGLAAPEPGAHANDLFAPTDGSTAASQPSSGLLSKWWFWALAGVATTVAVGGTVMLITSSGGGPSPSSDRVVTL